VCHPPAFTRRDRFGRFPEVPPFPCFDLDEHHRAAVARDDVDVPAALPVATFEHFVAATFKFGTCEIFPDPTQRLPGLRHGRLWCKATTIS
jgi:hypothetical protein